MQKISNVLFNGKINMNLCFLQLDSFLVILSIVGSEIEIERILFLVRIFINLARSHLQSNNLHN
jgi:hypothetical protein